MLLLAQAGPSIALKLCWQQHDHSGRHASGRPGHTYSYTGRISKLQECGLATVKSMRRSLESEQVQRVSRHITSLALKSACIHQADGWLMQMQSCCVCNLTIEIAIGRCRHRFHALCNYLRMAYEKALDVCQHMKHITQHCRAGLLQQGTAVKTAAASQCQQRCQDRPHMNQ